MYLIVWNTENGKEHQFGCKFCGSKSPYCRTKKDALYHALHRIRTDTKGD